MADNTKSHAEKAAFAVGTRRSLQDTISKSRDGSSVVGKIWTQDIRDKLRPLFKDDSSFNSFSRDMQLEQRMSKVNQALTSGSQTAQRQQFAREISEQPTSKATTALKAIISPKSTAVNTAINIMSDKLAKQARGMTKETSTEIMRYLTSNDPKLWSKLAQTIKESGNDPEMVYKAAKQIAKAKDASTGGGKLGITIPSFSKIFGKK